MKSKNKDYEYNIELIMGTIKENDSHDWCKAILRMTWNDNPPTIDIRNVNLKNKKMGKGISLSNEEVDKLVDILLENDFGSMEQLESAITKRKKIYTFSEEDLKDDDKYFVI